MLRDSQDWLLGSKQPAPAARADVAFNEFARVRRLEIGAGVAVLGQVDGCGGGVIGWTMTIPLAVQRWPYSVKT